MLLTRWLLTQINEEHENITSDTNKMATKKQLRNSMLPNRKFNDVQAY